MISLCLPKHIAIIMDGNGRWASERGLPRQEGHRQGVKILKKIIKKTSELGIKYLTVYAFSTENWKRPDHEVNFLMKLMERTMASETDELISNKIKINFIGRRDCLAKELKEKIKDVEKSSRKNDRLTLNIAFNYGGRAEIIDAVKNVIDNDLQADNISEDVFSKYLYQPDLPDVELLIRTGGDKRISNFLLWQLAYAEMFFSDKYWPDFSADDLQNAVTDFCNRERRFGGLKNAGDN